MLKSRVHYRAGFRDIAKEVIECAGTGVCTSDYDQLTFNNVRRPIYPLDLINDPDASWAGINPHLSPPRMLTRARLGDLTFRRLHAHSFEDGARR